MGYDVKPWRAKCSLCRSVGSFFIAKASLLNVCLRDTRVVDKYKFYGVFFLSETRLSMMGNETPCRVMQLATLRTANASPCISRHRSYTTQPRK